MVKKRRSTMGCPHKKKTYGKPKLALFGFKLTILICTNEKGKLVCGFYREWTIEGTKPGMGQGTRVKGKDMQCMKGVLVKDTHPSLIGIAYTYIL